MFTPAGEAVVFAKYQSVPAQSPYSLTGSINGQPKMILKHGTPVPGSTTGEVFGFRTATQEPNIFTNMPPMVVSDNGTVAFIANVLDAQGVKVTAAIMSASPNAAGEYDVSFLGRSDDRTVFPTNFNIKPPSIDSRGRVLLTGSLGETYLIDQAGVTRLTQDKQPIPRSPGQIFRGALSGQLAENGNVVLDGFGENFISAIFAGPVGNLKSVARVGDPTPLNDNSTYAELNDVVFGGELAANEGIAINGYGQAAFYAAVRYAESGLYPAALFATDRNDDTHAILKQGQVIDVAGGAKAIKSFMPLYASNNHDGQSSSFNDLGQLAVKLTFTDNSEALVLITLLSLLPADADNNNVVDFADFERLMNHFGDADANRTLGDFNYDAVVDRLDFDLFLANLGRFIDAPPPVITPDQRAAIDAFGQSIPEPAGLAPLALFLFAARRRRR